MLKKNLYEDIHKAIFHPLSLFFKSDLKFPFFQCLLPLSLSILDGTG